MPDLKLGIDTSKAKTDLQKINNWIIKENEKVAKRSAAFQKKSAKTEAKLAATTNALLQKRGKLLLAPLEPLKRKNEELAKQGIALEARRRSDYKKTASIRKRNIGDIVSRRQTAHQREMAATRQRRTQQQDWARKERALQLWLTREKLDSIRKEKVARQAAHQQALQQTRQRRKEMLRGVGRGVMRAGRMAFGGAQRIGGMFGLPGLDPFSQMQGMVSAFEERGIAAQRVFGAVGTARETNEVKRAMIALQRELKFTVKQSDLLTMAYHAFSRRANRTTAEVMAMIKPMAQLKVILGDKFNADEAGVAVMSLANAFDVDAAAAANAAKTLLRMGGVIEKDVARAVSRAGGLFRAVGGDIKDFTAVIAAGTLTKQTRAMVTGLGTWSVMLTKAVGTQSTAAKQLLKLRQAGILTNEQFQEVAQVGFKGLQKRLAELGITNQQQLAQKIKEIGILKLTRQITAGGNVQYLTRIRAMRAFNDMVLKGISTYDLASATYKRAYTELQKSTGLHKDYVESLKQEEVQWKAIKTELNAALLKEAPQLIKILKDLGPTMMAAAKATGFLIKIWKDWTIGKTGKEKATEVEERQKREITERNRRMAIWKRQANLARRLGVQDISEAPTERGLGVRPAAAAERKSDLINAIIRISKTYKGLSPLKDIGKAVPRERLVGLNIEALRRIFKEFGGVERALPTVRFEKSAAIRDLDRRIKAVLEPRLREGIREREKRIGGIAFGPDVPVRRALILWQENIKRYYLEQRRAGRMPTPEEAFIHAPVERIPNIVTDRFADIVLKSTREMIESLSQVPQPQVRIPELNINVTLKEYPVTGTTQEKEDWIKESLKTVLDKARKEANKKDAGDKKTNANDTVYQQ